jgi:hypothetical protein
MTLRSLPTGKRGALKGAQLKAIHHRPLELVADDEGSITLGWIANGVFYARFIGAVSATLAHEHLARLESALERVSSLSYFSDARALSSYELKARHEFARTIVAHRRKFQSIVLLTWPLGVTEVTRAFASSIGEPVELLGDGRTFEARLLDVAPSARAKLDPNGWMMAPQQPRTR